MASVIIVGDGPGGLSAALFLAKNGQDTMVFGTDTTAMHYAYLYNYLGLPEIAGTEFQRIARDQATASGARIIDAEVSTIGVGDTITVEADGKTYSSAYLILSEGKNPEIGRSLGLETDDGGAIVVDRDNRTSVESVYAVGRSVRPTRSQAIISAGAGAVAALDILAREAGKDIQDWDTPPKD